MISLTVARPYTNFAVHCVFSHMQMKMAGCFAREDALTTFVGLFSGVLPFVCLQMTSLGCGIVALVTFERFSPVCLNLCFSKFTALKVEKLH